MKVIKRDGHTVNYDRSKIIIAIEKANAESRVRRFLPKRSKKSSKALKRKIVAVCSSKIFRILSNRD